MTKIILLAFKTNNLFIILLENKNKLNIYLLQRKTHCTDSRKAL